MVATGTQRDGGDPNVYRVGRRGTGTPAAAAEQRRTGWLAERREAQHLRSAAGGTPRRGVERGRRRRRSGAAHAAARAGAEAAARHGPMAWEERSRWRRPEQAGARARRCEERRVRAGAEAEAGEAKREREREREEEEEEVVVSSRSRQRQMSVWRNRLGSGPRTPGAANKVCVEGRRGCAAAGGAGACSVRAASGREAADSQSEPSPRLAYIECE